MKQTNNLPFNEANIGNRCVIDPKKVCDGCGECMICDLDDNKICDNCGKCLDFFNTDEKGYVTVKVDKIVKEDPTLEDLYKQYGLDDDDEDDEDGEEK